MKEYTTEFIRNIALVSHGGAGKTMLAESFLHVTGATTRLGKVEDGTTASDYDDEEHRRKISIYTSLIPVEHKNYKINFLDAPGYTDFVGEMVSALSVADGAIILVDAVAGIEVGTEIAWRYCDQFNLPRFFVINKMDRENADFQKTLNAIKEFVEAHGKRVVQVHIPIGEKQNFKGVVDVIGMKSYMGDGKTTAEIPAELKEAAEKAHFAMVEDAAEGEDELMEKYLENGSLSDEEMVRGLEDVVYAGSFVPVFCAAGGHEIGTIALLNDIIDLMPSPINAVKRIAQGKDGDEELKPSDQSPLAAYVWKTTADPFVGKMTYFRVISGSVQADAHVWNQNKGADERMSGLHFQRGKESIAAKVVHAGDIAVVSKLTVTATGDTFCDKGHPLLLAKPAYPAALYRVAIAPKTQADAAKISTVLTRLSEEDMTLVWQNDMATHETVLQGMGDQHIDVAVHRAQAKFQVGIVTHEPKVPYREGITKKSAAQYRHKKQSGGAGQFGEVHLRIEPYMEGDFDFVDALVGMNLSRSYLPPIEKSIRATMEKGAFAGYPMSNVRVTVYDGKEHEVDSKPVAFEIAGREAFKLAVADAGPVLFEPIMTVRVTCPDANMGDVMSDLNTRRGRVQGTESERGNTTIIGTFHVKGFQPDGDSIRFQANKPEHWDFFQWIFEADKATKKKQLRVESIDAMETHYEGYHQPRPFALAAMESLLELINIKDVTYSLGLTQIVDADDGKAGFIASADIDRFGRPVSYLFPKTANLTDGAIMDSTALPIEDSINFQLAREGLVYPTFYTTTDRTFAEKIRAVVARARKTKRGIWSIDKTSDFTLWDIRTLEEDILLMPKLFRRLVSFFDNYSDFGKLQEYMSKQRDNLVLWDGTKKRSLADLMKFSGRRIQMKTPVEDILFSPK